MFSFAMWNPFQDRFYFINIKHKLHERFCSTAINKKKKTNQNIPNRANS